MCEYINGCMCWCVLGHKLWNVALLHTQAAQRVHSINETWRVSSQWESLHFTLCATINRSINSITQDKCILLDLLYSNDSAWMSSAEMNVWCFVCDAIGNGWDGKIAFHHPINYQLDFNTLKFQNAVSIDLCVCCAYHTVCIIHDFESSISERLHNDFAMIPHTK